MRTIADIEIVSIAPDEMAVAPQTFKDLVALIPMREAIALCAAIGGQELYLPSKASFVSNNPTWLAMRDSLSEASFERLLEAWGETRQFFPSLRAIKTMRLQNEIIGKLLDADLVTKAIDDVVATYGLSRSYVWRLIKRHRAKNSPSGVPVGKINKKRLRQRSLADLIAENDRLAVEVAQSAAPSPVRSGRALQGRMIVATGVGKR